MIVLLELSPEREALLKSQAQLRVLSLEEWLIELTDQQTPTTSFAHLQKTDPDEWARLFDAFLDSHDPHTPVLSEEAMSRESIYADRF